MRKRWMALGLTMGALCCAGSVFATISLWPRLFPPDPSLAVLAKVRVALAVQRTALLAGDEPGYLSTVDPAMPATERDGLLRQFRSLRAMQVAELRQDIYSAYSADERDHSTWKVDVRTTACFVTPACFDGAAKAKTSWVVDAQALMSSWQPAAEIHPWQADELVAKAGARSIVATTPQYAERLAAVVAAADEAAVVADRFAQDGKPPARYVVYYAGEQEWERWFDWEPGEYVAGVALNVGVDRWEVVVNAADVEPDDVDDVLRHELTHAASLPGRLHGDEARWWLVEGLAELGELAGLPAREHQGIAEAHELIAKAVVTGIEISGPQESSGEEVAAGRYAIAFLGMRCLAERFGEARVVQFFHDVLHGDQTLPAASLQVFGLEWEPVSRECFSYVEQAVG